MSVGSALRRCSGERPAWSVPRPEKVLVFGGKHISAVMLAAGVAAGNAAERPFVGRRKNLDEFLEIIARRDAVYHQCRRWPRAPGEPGGSATARPRAKSICAIICWRERLPSSPRVVVTLGNTPRTVLDDQRLPSARATAMRPASMGKVSFTLFPLYHRPASSITAAFGIRTSRTRSGSPPVWLKRADRLGAVIPL